jgi:hypothetical protein
MTRLYKLFSFLIIFLISAALAYANDQAALQECIAKALAEHPGQVLSSDIRVSGSKKYCVIKVLSSGRVYTLEYPL